MGPLRNGLRHGRGTLYFPNGDKYKGDYKDHVREGRGAYYFADGDKYKGLYLKRYFLDLRITKTLHDLNTIGTHRPNPGWVNNSNNFSFIATFKGEFFKDKKDGHGVFTSKNGDRLECNLIRN